MRIATLTTYKSQMSIYLFSHRLFTRHVYGHACHSIYVEDRNKFAGNSFSPYTVWVGLGGQIQVIKLGVECPYLLIWPYIHSLALYTHTYSQIKSQSTP